MTQNDPDPHTIQSVTKELGIYRDTVAERVKRGLLPGEVRLLGAVPRGLFNKRLVLATSKRSGIKAEILVYRVVVLGWTLKQAIEAESHPQPPPCGWNAPPKRWAVGEKDNMLTPKTPVPSTVKKRALPDDPRVKESVAGGISISIRRIFKWQN